MARSVKQQAADALFQADEIKALAKHCARCGVGYEPDNVGLRLRLNRIGVADIQVESCSLPATWERFGDGYVCLECWRAIRAWMAAKRREEAGI